MSGNIEYQAYNNAKAITELQYQLANGAITAEEYAKKMVGLDGQLAAGAITKGEYKTAVANLKKQLEDGTITQQEYNEAVLGLANQQDKIADDAYNQATALGCDSSKYTCGPDMAFGALENPAPEWVYSTNYWTASAGGTLDVWGVHSDGYFLDSDHCGDSGYCGVRPVITISTSEI